MSPPDIVSVQQPLVHSCLLSPPGLSETWSQKGRNKELSKTLGSFLIPFSTVGSWGQPTASPIGLFSTVIIWLSP